MRFVTIIGLVCALLFAACSETGVPKADSQADQLIIKKLLDDNGQLTDQRFFKEGTAPELVEDSIKKLGFTSTNGHYSLGVDPQQGMDCKALLAGPNQSIDRFIFLTGSINIEWSNNQPDLEQTLRNSVKAGETACKEKCGKESFVKPYKYQTIEELRINSNLAMRTGIEISNRDGSVVYRVLYCVFSRAGKTYVLQVIYRLEDTTVPIKLRKLREERSELIFELCSLSFLPKD